MDLQLKDKSAFVSGSTAGIGLAIATTLAAEGASVTLNGRTPARVGEAVAGILAAHPEARVRGFAADLSTEEGALALKKELPHVDILVNNLGIFKPQPFEEIPDAEWRRFFEVNVLSGIRLSRLYLQGMKDRKWGRIVFISSESGIHIPTEMIHYGMTKTAQLAIARGLAETTAGTGVTVNSILPGPTLSEGVGVFVSDMATQNRATQEETQRAFFQNVRPGSLLQRFATPEEIAALTTFICSPLSAPTNGAALRADGGLVRTIV